ncbi:MAG TPA: YIP1 family protein [Ignavibacteria bacterium]|nr:YIP1 family protein [Ignavibacteria bacterium]
MEENNQVTGEEITQQVEPLSKFEAISGVITAPSDTFETIAVTPKTNYWIMPTLLFMVAALIGAFLFLNDTELVTKTMDKRKADIQKGLDEKVKAGDLTQEQADQQMAVTEPFLDPNGWFVKVTGYGANIISPFFLLFFMSVLILIIMKIMRSPISFYNILNVVGLSLTIFAISSVVTSIISVLMGDLQTLGPGLILSEESVGAKAYAVLSGIDVFSIWAIAVMSIGLSKLGKVSLTSVAVTLYGVWLLLTVVRGLLT